MQSYKLLDVTLRDGGYKNNFRFSYEQVRNILTRLQKVGVDYIEVGYRNGSLKPISNIGITGQCPPDYLRAARQLITNSKMVVILHPHNVNLDELEELADCGVDLVRICYTKYSQHIYADYVKKARELGMEVTVNLTRVTQYQWPDLLTTIKQISALDLQALYFADSNGHLTPTRTKKLFKNASLLTDIELGLHAHNNLELALGNTIAAIEAGAKWIDASILGMGKGAGNLKLESFLGYQFAEYGRNQELNMAAVVEFQSYMKNIMPESIPRPLDRELVLGSTNLSADDMASVSIYEPIEDYVKQALALAGSQRDEEQ